MKKTIYIMLIFLGITASYAFKDDLFEISKQIEIFTTLFKELNINYVDEIPPAKLVNKAIQSMLSDLDPFTLYYNEQDLMSVEMEHLKNHFGIGAEVILRKDRLVITKVYKSYPADLSGLKPGDEITEINGIKVKGFEGNVLELLKGEKGSKLTLVYSGRNKNNKVTLSRDDKPVKTVPFYGKVNSETGYIVLTHFDKKASENVREALEDLKKDGIKSVILDLRNNPGGLLNEAVEIVNLFVPKNQIVVSTKSKMSANNKIYRTKKQAVDSLMPVAVIINGQSASASEIVSGAFQDLDRGVIIGKTSYGKGLVQRYLDLPYGSKMKITISRYYTPSGRCIQALDYSRKNLDGEAKRIEKKYYNEYKTKNGRLLYDRGGISPDIDTGTEFEKTYLRHFAQNPALFDFATNYYYKNPALNGNTFAFGNTDFEDFKTFVLNYEDSGENHLAKDLKKNLSSTGLFLGKTLKAKAEELLKTIKLNDIEMLDAYKDEVVRMIEEEIAGRYMYEREFHRYKIAHDPEIRKAAEIVRDKKKYDKILWNNTR